jgi:hypothetical protein
MIRPLPITNKDVRGVLPVCAGGAGDCCFGYDFGRPGREISS